MYGSGVASLIGDSGISLDGQSIQLPDDPNYEIQDDISSIHDASYCRGFGYRDTSPKIKIVGTASSMEEGNIEALTPASMALSAKGGNGKGSKNDKDSVSSSDSSDGSEKRPPNMKNTNKLSVDGSKKGCIPAWIAAAPTWLKLVIAFSFALLIGAIVLVTVALSTALASQNEEPDSMTASENFVTFAPGEVPFPPNNSGVSNKPTAAPVQIDTESDALSITNPPVETDPPTSAPETEEPTSSPTKAPIATPQTPSPSAGETIAATTEDSNPTGTDAASIPYDPYVTTFFVTGGRFTNDALARVPDQLKTLPVRGGTSFLVHLGDWNSPYATRCDRQSYKDVDALFSNSSIPVYFVTGDNDFNDCPDPDQAMSFWHEYLLEYETKHWDAPSQWTVAHGASDLYPENFAFIYNEILFVGINLVGGVVHNSTEWDTRHKANLDWIDANIQQNKQSIKAFVLFAHADPDVPSNSGFYEPFKEKVKKDYKEFPVVLIHRNLGVEPWSWEDQFENINNLSVIVVAGSVWPPLMGAVDFRQEKPFVFDQGSWYDEYIEHQTNSGRA